MKIPKFNLSSGSCKSGVLQEGLSRSPQPFNNQKFKSYVQLEGWFVMSLPENLEKLSNASGVVGREEEVRNLMVKLMQPHVDEVYIDKLENVVAVKKGKTKVPKVMLAAHMDEIGLMVKIVNKEGFIQFAKMGGIDDRLLMAQKVIVQTAKGPIH